MTNILSLGQQNSLTMPTVGVVVGQPAFWVAGTRNALPAQKSAVVHAHKKMDKT